MSGFAVHSLAVPLSFGFRREMAQRFGYVEPYGSGWAVRFVVDGKIYRITAIPMPGRWMSLKGREMAEEVLEEIRREIRSSGDVITAISPFMSRSKLLGVERRWLEWVEVLKARESAGQLSHRRLKELEGHLSRGHLDAIKERPLQGLDYAALEELHAALFAKGLAPKSVHHVLADVRTFLRWCARRKWIHAVPEIPATLLEEYAPTIPSRDEQRARLAGIDEADRGYFLLRALLGVRHQEAIRANLADYRRGSEGRDEIVIRGKGRTFRVLPVPAELADWVRAHRPALGEAGTPLFVNSKTGERWKPKAIERRWAAMEKALGLPHVKANEALRHTFGTRSVERLMADGMSREEAQAAIMRVMGHVSKATSDRYVKLAAETLRTTIE